MNLSRECKSKSRTAEKVLSLKELIGDENAEKVLSLINDCKNFYKFDSIRLSRYNSIYFYSPCSNRETVAKAWKQCFDKDITIPANNEWKDIYEADDSDEM